MEHTSDISRFVDVHKRSFPSALEEIKNGRKSSHWMWYIFPQMRGLGMSSMSWDYGIQSLDEAAAFLHDPYLGRSLLEICQALLELETDNATEVFGDPDDKKLKSSMTLFSLVPDADLVFQEVLNKYYGGKRDKKTLEILGMC